MTRKIKIIPTTVTVATITVILGISLGVGLGVGLRHSSISDAPIEPSNPNTEDFNFTTQNVNSNIKGVLAVDITNRDTSLFSDLAYITKYSPTVVNLPNSTSEFEFTLATGESSPIYNSFNQNGHLYVPTDRTAIPAAKDMEIEETTSDTGSNTYLYVDNFGQFDESGLYTREFIPSDLASSYVLNLTFSTGVFNQVPQPNTPTTKALAFNTSQVDTTKYKNSLNANPERNTDISDLRSLVSSTSNGLEFDSNLESSEQKVNILTGSTNLIFYRKGNLYLPIKQITIGQKKVVYLVITSVNVDNINYLIATGLAESDFTSVFSLYDLRNSPSTLLIFSNGN